VLGIGQAGEISGRASVDCRGLADNRDEGTFAFVRYNHMPWTLHRAIVPVPEGLQPGVGDRVYVNIRNCKESIARVTEPR